MNEVLFEVHGSVGWIRLNRPERLNAMTDGLIGGALSAVAEADARDDVTAVVLTGAGRGFCSGADLSGLAEERGEGPAAPGTRLTQRRVQELTQRIYELGLPTIAAVNGPAVGAGFELTLACDIRIMGSSGYFKHGALPHGLVSGDGSAFFLPRMIGLSRSLEILLRERRVLPDEAVTIGLAAEVVPDAHLGDTVQELAAQLGAVPNGAVRMTKEAVRLGLSLGEPAAIFSYLRLAVDHGKLEQQATKHAAGPAVERELVQ